MFYRIVKGLIRPIIYLLYRPNLKGLNNFPQDGKVILYSNHISILDPILIACVLPRKIHFMAKIELFKNPLFKFILKTLGAFPVKRGAADLSAIKNSLQVLRRGDVFGIFPEGTRGKQGEIRSFSHGVASIAHRSKAKIIPVGIMGEYKVFRSIKVNIGEELNMEHYFQQKSGTELLELMSKEMEGALKVLLEG